MFVSVEAVENITLFFVHECSLHEEKTEWKAKGYPELDIRIGINSYAPGPSVTQSYQMTNQIIQFDKYDLIAS